MGSVRSTARKVLDGIRRSPAGVAGLIMENNPKVSAEDAQKLATLFIGVYHTENHGERMERFKAYRKALKDAGGNVK